MGSARSASRIAVIAAVAAVAAVPACGGDTEPLPVVADSHGGDRDAAGPPPASCRRCVEWIAGSGEHGLIDGPAEEARFELPRDLAVDAEGRVYVADQLNHRIRRIAAGEVTTFAGTSAGFRDGPAREAMFGRPAGIAIDARGRVFVADCDNHRVRVIEDGVVTTLAGSGERGFLDGPAGEARFDQPVDVEVDGDAVLVVDLNNVAIRRIEGGVVTTLARSGPGGPAFLPRFVARVPGGPIAFTDGFAHTIRAIEDTGVRAVAGNVGPGYVDGAGLSAKFDEPAGIAADADGRLFIADARNERIRMLMLGEHDTVRAVAGSGYLGGSDGDAMRATFHHPVGVAVDPRTREVYVSDVGNVTIRVFRP